MHAFAFVPGALAPVLNDTLLSEVMSTLLSGLSAKLPAQSQLANIQAAGTVRYSIATPFLSPSSVHTIPWLWQTFSVLALCMYHPAGCRVLKSQVCLSRLENPSAALILSCTPYRGAFPNQCHE